MATASTKEYGVRAKDSHWGTVFLSHVDFPRDLGVGHGSGWPCGVVWSLFTGLPWTAALGLAVCTLVFRFFAIVFPHHDATFLFTWAPTHTVSSHPDSLPFWSPRPLPAPCPVKAILFSNSNQSLSIFMCPSQCFLCASSFFMCQGGTSQQLFPLSMKCH